MKITVLMSTLALAPVANASLIRKLHQELTAPSAATKEQVRQHLKDKNVVFIKLKNLMFKGLHAFDDNKKALEDLGHRNAEIIETDFFASYDDNATALGQELRRLYENDPQKRPLLLIGNPQSGPDALYTVLKDPSLLSDGIVGKLVLLLPAFGSPLVQAADDSRISTKLMDEVHALFGKDLRKFMRASTRKLFADLLAEGSLTSEQRRLLHENLYYVRGYATINDVTPWQKNFFKQMNQLYPGQRTDSTSLTAEQKIDCIGTDLGVVPADHWDLFATNRGRIFTRIGASNSPARYRRAFTRALILEVFSERVTSEPKKCGP